MVLKTYVVDIKAHTYNNYLDGQPYDTGDTASFEIENGLIQTGIAYPKSYNATKNMSFAPNHVFGSPIEFAGHTNGDFTISDYKLIEIRVQRKTEN